MPKISILGCGWLGFPLARKLVQDGHSVKGSTTSAAKLSLLEEAGIKSFLVSLKADGIAGDIEAFLEASTILIIDTPPKLHGVEKESFVAKIEILIPYIAQSTIENVLFISSTAVYGDGEKQVTEASPLHPDTESGKELVASEKLLQQNLSFTTILRFGGLIGEDRHPIKFLAGKKALENPEGPINLIHQEDCIGIILKIIETHSWGETFNAVAPFHPSRKAYYTAKALERGLEPPTFNDDKPSRGKIIEATKLEKLLGYVFVWKEGF